jgi:hypothetical protein
VVTLSQPKNRSLVDCVLIATTTYINMMINQHLLIWRFQ